MILHEFEVFLVYFSAFLFAKPAIFAREIRSITTNFCTVHDRELRKKARLRQPSVKHRHYKSNATIINDLAKAHWVIVSMRLKPFIMFDCITRIVGC